MPLFTKLPEASLPFHAVGDIGRDLRFDRIEAVGRSAQGNPLRQFRFGADLNAEPVRLVKSHTRTERSHVSQRRGEQAALDREGVGFIPNRVAAVAGLVKFDDAGLTRNHGEGLD